MLGATGAGRLSTLAGSSALARPEGVGGVKVGEKAKEKRGSARYSDAKRSW